MFHKKAARYASQPSLPMGQMGGAGGMGFQPRTSQLTGMGPNSGIAQAANAAQQNPNPLTQVSPGKHGLATTTGIQQMAQQANQNNAPQPAQQPQNPPAPTAPQMGMMPKMGSLRARSNWLEGLIPLFVTQVKQAEVTAGGNSAPQASASTLGSGGQTASSGTGSPGMGTPAGRPGSQNQQGNAAGGGGTGGGMGMNSQLGVPGSQIGAFGLVRPGWDSLRPANSGFGGVTPPTAGSIKTAQMIGQPVPGMTANQPAPQPGMAPPPPGLPAMPPPNGGAPIPGIMGQPSIDPSTGQPLPPPGGAVDPATGQPMDPAQQGQPQPPPTQPDAKTGQPTTSPMQDPPPLPLPSNPRMTPPRPQPTPRDNFQMQTMNSLFGDKAQADVPMNAGEAQDDMQSQAMAMGSKTASDRDRILAELALGTRMLLKSGFWKQGMIDDSTVDLGGQRGWGGRTIHDGPPSFLSGTSGPKILGRSASYVDPSAATASFHSLPSTANKVIGSTAPFRPSRGLLGRVPGGKTGLIMGAAGTLGGGLVGALAHSLFKKGSQDDDGRKDTAKSAVGESKGLKYQYKADHHAQGQEAWESVSQYFKGHAKRTSQPNPSMGKHASVSTGTPGTHTVGIPATQTGFPKPKVTGTAGGQPKGPIVPMGNPTPPGAFAMTPEKAANALSDLFPGLLAALNERGGKATGFDLPKVELPKPDVGGLLNPDTPKDAPGVNVGIPLIAGIGGLGLGYALGGRGKKKEKEAADYSRCTDFARGFFEACDRMGVTHEEAVEKVGSDFGPEAQAELRDGLEKRAFKQWVAQNAPAAAKWVGGKLGFGSGGAATNFGRGLFGVTPKALPGTSGAFGATRAAMPTYGSTAAYRLGAGTANFGGQAGRQLAPMAGGAVGGGLAGDDLGLGGDHIEGPLGLRLNERGMYAGAAAANPFLRRQATQRMGGAASMPMAGMRNAWMGSLGGGSIDMLAGAAGYDTGGRFGRLGAQAAFGLGTARQGVRMAPNWFGGTNKYLSGVNSALGAGEKGMRQFSSEAFRGLHRPLTYPVRAAYNYVRGTPGTQLIGGTTGAAGRAGRLVGAGTVGIGGAGLGYGMAKDKLTNDAREMVGQTAGEMIPEIQNSMGEWADNYMASRGMMDETGQFNPMMAANRQGGIMGGLMRGSDDIFRTLGMDPSKMSPLQKVMILGGAVGGGGGMLAGAPALAGVGGVSALAGLLPQLMPSQSQQTFNGQQAPYRPGQGGVGQTGGVNQPQPTAPQARNEWAMFNQGGGQ